MEEVLLEGPIPVPSPACVGGLYLINFLFGNLSYSPGSEPSRTVLLLDVMYTMYARHPSYYNSPPFTVLFINLRPYVGNIFRYYWFIHGICKRLIDEARRILQLQYDNIFICINHSFLFYMDRTNLNVEQTTLHLSSMR